MANKYYKVYKASQKLGQGLKKAKVESAGYGSAFVKGVSKGYKGPKKPSGKTQTHLQKHWKKYAHGAVHVGSGAVAYGAGLKHGASLKDFNPYQRKENKKLEKALNKMNKAINKATQKKLKERGY